MASDKSLQFGPYTVDPASERLWRDGEPLHLTPKSLAVLLCLVRERPRLVTKNELLDTVWPDVHAGDAVLKVAVREIRRLSRDTARQARDVGAVHRRGYRFVSPIAYVSVACLVEATGHLRTATVEPPSTGCGHPLVGRGAPLARFEAAFERAMSGQRQVVFVSGESGIGKTSAIEAFLSRVERSDRAAVSRGQCVEQASVPEPYLAVLDAFSRLLKRRHRAEVESALKRWRRHGLRSSGAAAAAGDGLAQDTLGATPGRMLRRWLKRSKT